MNRRLASMLMLPLTMAMLVSCTVKVEAEHSSPTPPFAPDPAICTVTPRPIESIIEVVGTPVAGESTVSGTPAAPPALPKGTIADAATADAVKQTIIQLFACTNAGDFLRVYAFFSDNFLVQFFAGTPLTDEVVALISATPQPLPEDQLRIIVSIGKVRILDDGSAVVEVVVDEPGEPRYQKRSDVVLVNVDGHWLIDQEIERATNATPDSGN